MRKLLFLVLVLVASILLVGCEPAVTNSANPDNPAAPLGGGGPTPTPTPEPPSRATVTSPRLHQPCATTLVDSTWDVHGIAVEYADGWEALLYRRSPAPRAIVGQCGKVWHNLDTNADDVPTIKAAVAVVEARLNPPTPAPTPAPTTEPEKTGGGDGNDDPVIADRAPSFACTTGVFMDVVVGQKSIDFSSIPGCTANKGHPEADLTVAGYGDGRQYTNSADQYFGGWLVPVVNDWCDTSKHAGHVSSPMLHQVRASNRAGKAYMQVAFLCPGMTAPDDYTWGPNSYEQADDSE